MFGPTLLNFAACGSFGDIPMMYRAKALEMSPPKNCCGHCNGTCCPPPTTKDHGDYTMFTSATNTTCCTPQDLCCENVETPECDVFSGMCSMFDGVNTCKVDNGMCSAGCCGADGPSPTQHLFNSHDSDDSSSCSMSDSSEEADDINNFTVYNNKMMCTPNNSTCTSTWDDEPKMCSPNNDQCAGNFNKKSNYNAMFEEMQAEFDNNQCCGFMCQAQNMFNETFCGTGSRVMSSFDDVDAESSDENGIDIHNFDEL